MTDQPPSETHKHAARAPIQGEHPWGDRGQLVCLALFLMVWILDSFVFQFSTSLSGMVPLYIRIFAAGVVFLFALYLIRSGHRAISHEVQSHQRVLQDGAFARVRHPLYLAALLFYIIIVVLTLSLISLGLFAGVFVFYNAIAAYEERWLEQKFGQDYRRYKNKVPRWIPRFVPARF